MNKMKRNYAKYLNILVIVAVVLTAVLSATSPALAATEPSLGTAAAFAVLGGSAITNAGSTTIAGDVGISPNGASSVTGFPPGSYTGTLHAADAVALQAQNDVTTAYNTLAGQAYDVDKTGQDLGGQTLPPGVYRYSTSAQLTGTLTLDAQGNPNAVFIFQIGSTLTTASGSRVVVINGGSNCKVYWQVGSSATIGTTTAFAGNILALTSITLNNGATLAGRALARNGAVTMDTNNIAICPASCPTITLAPTTLPDGTLSVAYSQPITATGGTSPYTFTIILGALPTGLTLTTGGLLSGTPSAAGSFTFTVKATDNVGCFGTQIYTIIINPSGCPVISLSPTTLPTASVGIPYSQTITASGGTAPYTYLVTYGSPPAGLSLSSAGVLSGTRTSPNNYTFTVTATDSAGCRGSRIYTMLGGCPVITISPTTLPEGTYGIAYSQTITASGGASPYTFAITSGAPPTGLSLSSGGVLSGTPSATGSFTFTVRATDSAGCLASRTYTGVNVTIPPRNTLLDDNASPSMIVTQQTGWCKRPDNMCVRYVDVKPQVAQVGQPVTIFANIVNYNNDARGYIADLKINGQIVDTRTGSIPVNSGAPLEFTVTKSQPGQYTVDINGTQSSFTVVGTAPAQSSPINREGLIVMLVLCLLIFAAVAVLLVRHLSAR